MTLRRAARLPLLLLLLLLIAAAGTALAESRPGPTLVPPPPDTATPTETATPTSTPTAPKPSGPLLDSLLSESWWLPNTNAISVTVVAAWQPLGAASQADSYLDLTGNGHNITTGVEPTWTAPAGWTFNGSTDYLATGITPPAGYIDYSLLVWHTTGSGNARAVISADNKNLDAQRVILMIRPSTGVGVQYYNGSAAKNVTPSLLTGLAGIAGATAYRDGVADGTITRQSATTHGQIFLGARAESDTPVEFYVGTIALAAIYETTLDGTQVAEIATKVANTLATPTETPTPTNTPTATPTATAITTPTPSPTPAPGLYTVELPSGNTATVEASATAGQLLAAIALGSITLLVLFGELRTIANLVANK